MKQKELIYDKNSTKIYRHIDRPWIFEYILSTPDNPEKQIFISHEQFNKMIDENIRAKNKETFDGDLLDQILSNPGTYQLINAVLACFEEEWSYRNAEIKTLKQWLSEKEKLKTK